jgi:hypothetical protein
VGDEREALDVLRRPGMELAIFALMAALLAALSGRWGVDSRYAIGDDHRRIIL